MTRKPQKSRAKARTQRLRKRAALRRKALPSRRRGRTRPTQAKASPKAAGRDPLDDFVAAAARVLELKIETAWKPAVRANLAAILRHAAAVSAFALSDEAEPAPVFQT
jgi:hypothetical protein